MPRDLDMFRSIGVDADLLVRAGIRRVTDVEAREYGIKGSGDYAGIIFPYFDPQTGERRTCRLRRDNPDFEGGKPKGRYINPWGDRRHAYLVPESSESIQDVSVPAILVEAEKSVLSLVAWAERNQRKLVPVGLGGAWGWRCRRARSKAPAAKGLTKKVRCPNSLNLRERSGSLHCVGQQRGQ